MPPTRRSTQCTHGDHNSCVKFNGSNCPCICHTIMPTNNPDLTSSPPYINWKTLYKDNPQVNWIGGTTGSWCYDNAIIGTEERIGANNFIISHKHCHKDKLNPDDTIKIKSGYLSNNLDKCECPCHEYYKALDEYNKQIQSQLIQLPSVTDNSLDYIEVGNRHNIYLGHWGGSCIGAVYPEYKISSYHTRDHNNCTVINCECPHHKGLPVPVIGNMPLNTKSNFQQTVARLAPIAESIKHEFFLDEDIEFQIVGSTVRDALFGGLVEEYQIRLINSNITTKFLFKFLESFKDSDDNYTLATKFGKLKIKFIETQSLWNCDNFAYSLTRGISRNSDKCRLIEKSGILSLVGNYKEVNKIANQTPQEILEYGVKVAQQYGWTIDQESVTILAKAIQHSQPINNTHELVVGFRAYNIISGQLHGQYEVWNSESNSVSCPDFKEHINDVNADWRGVGRPNNHECGIYLYKDPSEALFHYGVQSAAKAAIALVYCWGIIGEFEQGYRAQNVEIQRLWIWDKDTKLQEGKYKIREIISGCKFTDFLYDQQVMQFAGRVDSNNTKDEI